MDVPAVEADDLCEDAFGPLARDAAAPVAVGVRLQKALLAFAALGHPGLGDAVLHQSRRAQAQAGEALRLDGDRAEIVRLAEAVAGAVAARAQPAAQAADRAATS